MFFRTSQPTLEIFVNEKFLEISVFKQRLKFIRMYFPLFQLHNFFIRFLQVLLFYTRQQRSMSPNGRKQKLPHENIKKMKEEENPIHLILSFPLKEISLRQLLIFLLPVTITINYRGTIIETKKTLYKTREALSSKKQLKRIKQMIFAIKMSCYFNFECSSSKTYLKKFW